MTVMFYSASSDRPESKPFAGAQRALSLSLSLPLSSLVWCINTLMNLYSHRQLTKVGRNSVTKYLLGKSRVHLFKRAYDRVSLVKKIENLQIYKSTNF